MIILMSSKDISYLLYALNTINGRSGGHYALVKEQPLRGRAKQKGGGGGNE